MRNSRFSGAGDASQALASAEWQSTRSEPRGQRAVVGHVRLPSLQAATPFRHQASTGPAWIMSLADLCLLMLTFCVLVFSMAVPSTEAWMSMIEGFSTREDILVQRPVRETSPARAAEPFNLTPGDDLRYVGALIDQAAIEQPVLKTIQRRRGADTTLLILPNGVESVSLRLLAPILDRLPNRVAVQTTVDLKGATGKDALQRWEQAVQTSMKVANALNDAGYGSHITPLVRLAPGTDRDLGQGAQASDGLEVGIVLLPEAEE